MSVVTGVVRRLRPTRWHSDQKVSGASSPLVRRVRGGLVAGAALAALAAPSADAASSSIGPSCRAASGQAYGSGVSSRLFAMGNSAYFADESPAVWANRDRAFAGVLVQRRSGRYRLSVCAVAARALARRNASVVAAGRTATLRRGERPRRAAVSDRWLAWAGTSAGRSGFVVRRQALNGRRASSRRFRGRVLALTMTRDGTVAVSTLDGRRQRVWRWRTNGRADALMATRTVASSREATLVQLWDPDSFLLTGPDDQEDSARLAALPVERVQRTARAKPCRVWTRSGSHWPTATVRSGAFEATLTSSDAWSHQALFTGRDWEGLAGSLRRLEVCDRATGEPTLAVAAGYDSNVHNVDYDQLMRVVIVGTAVFATGQARSGDTGSGSSGAPFDVGYVRQATGWQKVAQHVATPSAAAWIADGQVWALDATGLRAVGPVPSGFRGLRLHVTDSRLTIVAASGETTVALSPLPADQSGFPSDGRPFSPTGTQLPDGTTAASNFGVCSDKEAAYCPDPAGPKL